MWRYPTLETPAMLDKRLRAASSSIGDASMPTRNRRLRSISTTATTASSTPTRIEPIASGVGEPVIWCSATPPPAMRMPISAAASSANTALNVGSDVCSAWSSRSRSIDCASRPTCRNAWANDTPSSTNAMPSTAYAIV